MYESYSPKRTVGDGFDSPSLVLGGSSGGEAGSAANRSIKQQVLSRLAHGRRVLLSITKLGKQPAAPRHPRRLEISSPCSSAELPPVTVPRPRPELASPQSARGPASPGSTDSGGVPRSASFRRPTKPSAPPPPPPVQVAVVPIRTSAAHAPSVRSSSQYSASAAPPSPPPPTAGARAQPTPPQLKRVLPPVVPPRRDSLTPEREPPGTRPPGDGSELTQQIEEKRTSPPRVFTQPVTPPLHKYEPEPEPESEPETDCESKYEPKWEPEYEPKWEPEQREPEPELERKVESEEPSPFHSVIEEPTQVRLTDSRGQKTKFSFLFSVRVSDRVAVTHHSLDIRCFRCIVHCRFISNQPPCCINPNPR